MLVRKASAVRTTDRNVSNKSSFSQKISEKVGIDTATFSFVCQEFTREGS